MKKLHVILNLNENDFLYLRDSAIIEKISISEFINKYIKSIIKLNGEVPKYEKIFKE